MRDGWAGTTLGEAAEVLMGQSPPGSTYNTEGVGLPFLQGSAEFGDYHPVPEKWCSAPKKVAEPGDLLVSVRAPVGDRNYADQRYAVGRGLSVIRGTELALTEYLGLAIEYGIAELEARSGGGMFASITKTGLLTLPMLLPPLAEQRRIVDLIAATEACIRAARVHVDGSQTLAGAALNARFKSLQEGQSVHLSNVVAPNAKISYGVLKPGDFTDDGPLMVRGQDIRSGSIDHSALVRIAPSVSDRFRRTVLEGGEVLIALVGTTGHAAVADHGLIGANVSRAVGVIPCDSGAIRPQYLVAFFESPVGRAATDRLLTGAVQKVLNLGALRDIEVPLPSLREQDETVTLYESLRAVSESGLSELNRLQRLRSSLLDELLGGHHSIPPSYEELLERAS